MAYSTKNLKRIKSELPPRILIYGPPKLGKTTLANEFPDAVFLQTETGETSTDYITTWGKLSSYDDVIECIGALYNEDHGYKTMVHDSLDKFEPLIHDAVCREAGVNSIEDVGGGYQKGYVEAIRFWRHYIEGCDALRIERGMTIINIAHSEVTRFDDPRSVSYSKYDIRLHKHALGLIQDEMDLIIHLNQEPVLVKTTAQGALAKSGKQGRTYADGGFQRWMIVEGRPNTTAGNRLSMPPKIPFIRGKGYSELAKFFPHVNIVPEPEPVETEPIVTNGKKAKAA